MTTSHSNLSKRTHTSAECCEPSTKRKPVQDNDGSSSDDDSMDSTKFDPIHIILFRAHVQRMIDEADWAQPEPVDDVNISDLREESSSDSDSDSDSDSESESASESDGDKSDPDVRDSDCIIFCPGPNCNHKRRTSQVPIIPGHLLAADSNYKITLKDLIDLGASYHCCLQLTFGKINLARLARLHKPLTKLQSMVGMHKIKESITEQIIYFLLDLEPNPSELLHTVLVGPPGVGKSHIIELLAEIYLGMGYLKKNVIKRVKISDLKGKYVGHTAPLTQDAINAAMGGVLVIDEAYSLGSEDHLDSFSKEIIDTLNRNLTEHAGKFVCIIAGYEDQIETCLFAHNAGLKSRFRFRFEIDTYTAEELAEIFTLKVELNNWDFHPNFTIESMNAFFKDHHVDFEHYGRDMETLLFHTKVAHSNRMFLETLGHKQQLTLADLKAGFDRFSLHNNIKEKVESVANYMYL